jgi:hypothetical protein
VNETFCVSFGDLRSERYGLARIALDGAAGGSRRARVLALLFAGRAPVAALARDDLPVAAGDDANALELPGIQVDAAGETWQVRLDAEDGHGFALDFAPLGAAAELPAARLGGIAGHDQPCRVTGSVRTGGHERAIDALGARGRGPGEPDWTRFVLARRVAAWTDETAAALAVVRPAGARHHGEEAAWGALWEPGGLLSIADARLSTTYDAGGRTRRAGIELWPAGPEDEALVRRGAAEALCGSSLALGPLRLDCAFLRWQLEGRPGVGRYDVLRRAA